MVSDWNEIVLHSRVAASHVGGSANASSLYCVSSLSSCCHYCSISYCHCHPVVTIAPFHTVTVTLLSLLLCFVLSLPPCHHHWILLTVILTWSSPSSVHCYIISMTCIRPQYHSWSLSYSLSNATVDMYNVILKGLAASSWQLPNWSW